MKSLVDLVEHLLQDCGRRSSVPVKRDVQTLRSRVEHEGDSFLTIALPAFCSDFERSLDQGRVVPGAFASFGKLRSGIPEFLQGFLHRVFDQDGNLVDQPPIDCIRAVRQICLACKKVERTCAEHRMAHAIEAYVQCDSDIGSLPDDQLSRYIRLVAAQVLRSTDLNDLETLSRVMPTHGPGATAERVMGNQKWRFRRWHKRLDDVGFTYGRFAKGVYTPEVPETRPADWPDSVEPGDEDPVRVVFVPKTMKAPRVIAVEPVCMQFMQQGLRRLLYSQLECNRYTRGHVNFRDQTVNQDAALWASKTGEYATLDMSEASDRVSVAHAEAIFGSVPLFLERILACRSTRAQLPTGEVITLSKFASMGSALCFPVEALAFFCAIVASRIRRAGHYPSARHVYTYSRDVYVYGDDLIVPADEALSICEDLEALGFKVNHRKSFWNGKFRESCGADCYGGELVTPVYIRRDIPTDRGDVSGLLSAVATANQLMKAGYYGSANLLRKQVERILGPLPEVREDSPAIGWTFVSENVPPTRYNERLQRVEMRAWVVEVPRDPDPLDGEEALAKCFRVIGCPTLPDEEHLSTSPRPYGLALKRRWVAAT